MAGSGPRTLNGKIVLQVWLLDNSYKTLLIEPKTTVAAVCLSMAEKIGFSDPDDDSLCFSLNECLDGVTIGRALPPDREVLGIMEEWVDKPDARFIFQCKLYTDGIINSSDPKIIHMLFIQAVYNVISSTYPTTDKEAVQLAALQFQAKFGAHNPGSHKPGFLTSSLLEYVPLKHLEATGTGAGVAAGGGTYPKANDEWEKLLFHKHAFSTTDSPREAYISSLSKRDYYGSVLFAVKQSYDRSMPKKILLGISRRGIVLLRMPKSAIEGDMETLARFPLADIYRWAYKPGVNFYYEIKGSDSDGGDAGNPVFTFETVEGKHMSDMLTEYALALLREMGLNPDGTKRVRPKDRKAEEEAAAAAAASLAASAAAAAATSAVAKPAAVTAQPAAGPQKAAAVHLSAGASDAYSAVGGDAGTLAVAALRSGEYHDAGSAVAAAGGAGAAVLAPPPPPPAVPAPAAAALPPNWMECLDEGSGDYYYFNSVTGQSVWEKSEIPGYGM